MEKILEELRQQESPADGLVWLAKRVATLESRIQELERANVSGWDEWSGETPPLADEWEPHPEDVARVEAIKEKLQGCEDAEESLTLRAELELAEDSLKPPIEQYDPTGDHTNIEADDDGDAMVQLPKVNDEKMAARRKFAAEVLMLEDIYGEEKGAEYIESYAKGGPLILYYGDRDFVLGLTDEIKRSMVNDVAEQSPKEAHEMARDVLKDLEAQGPDVAVENLVRTMKK